MDIFIRSESKEGTPKDWYDLLSKQGQYIADMIFKNLNYFRKKDNKFRNFVCIFKILIFFFAMCNTIVLGVNFITENNYQINIGLILSAIITFLTTMAAFFNFEQYWMKNKVIYIELNMIRDDFIFDVKANKMNDKRLEYYLGRLNEMQNKNIKYWKNAILKLK